MHQHYCYKTNKQFKMGHKYAFIVRRGLHVE